MFARPFLRVRRGRRRPLVGYSVLKLIYSVYVP